MYFKDEEHFKGVCGYDIDNIWYPRVTKIVEIKSKPALYKFYADLPNFEAGEAVKNESAKQGTLIHDTFEKILVGDSPAVPPEIAPAIKAAVDFLTFNHIQVDPEFVEKRVFNPRHRYAGTIDTVALIDGRLGILDIKTSQAIYRDYNLQTAAYMNALKDAIPSLQTRWIMRIDQVKICRRCQSILRGKGGRDKIRSPYPRPNGWQDCPDKQHDFGELTGVIELKEFPYWQEDFSAFLGAKKLWEWENDFWLRRIGYL